MKMILSNRTDPYFNLAWEEYIFKQVNTDEDIVLLWQNEPSVIVGRNQNMYSEVNVSYCEQHKIPIIRRISGGGTVYHDLGNLNYSIITKRYRDVLSNYHYFTKPIIDFLSQLGVYAEFSGKSDIKIENKKISGNAQMYHQNKMLHHGTILFDTNLAVLNQVIKQATKDIDSIGVPSNRSMVTNVLEYLKPIQTMDAFKQQLLLFYLNNEIDTNVYTLTEEDLRKIEELKTSKYMTWAWNYGESPYFEVKKQINDQQLHIKVISGLITELSLSIADKTMLLPNFNGIKFNKVSFNNVLNELDIDIRKQLNAFKHLLFAEQRGDKSPFKK